MAEGYPCFVGVRSLGSGRLGRSFLMASWANARRQKWSSRIVYALKILREKPFLAKLETAMLRIVGEFTDITSDVSSGTPDNSPSLNVLIIFGVTITPRNLGLYK